MRAISLLLFLLALPASAVEPLRVAVAANFRHTLEQVNAEFSARSGIQVALSSASTGVLYSQISHGAPFDIFFAADTDTPARLAAGDRRPFCYARGRLVLVGGAGGLDALADSSLTLAIANPVTAPYGRAAREVLARPEFSTASGRRLLRGSNVVQAYQFWHSGGADLALVPRALATGAVPVPAEWHRPVDQHAIALGSGAAVDAYLSWIRSDRVRALINDAGYEPCP